MRKEEDMGRIPGHLAQDEEKLTMDSVFQREKDSCRREKDIFETMLKDLFGDRTDIENEKTMRGSIPQSMAHENLLRTFSMGFLLCISLGGEWILLKLNFLRNRFSTAKEVGGSKE